MGVQGQVPRAEIGVRVREVSPVPGAGKPVRAC